MVLNETSKKVFCSKFLPLLNKKEKNKCFTQQDDGQSLQRQLDRSNLDNRRRKFFREGRLVLQATGDAGDGIL